MIQTQTPPPALTSNTEYWETFEQLQDDRAGREPAWLAALRRKSVSNFAETGIPTTQDEDWRFTNVSPLARWELHPRRSASPEGLPAGFLEQRTFGHLAGSRLVFVDGFFRSEFSTIHGAAGALVMPLSEAIREHGALVEQNLARHASSGQNPFAVLNTAFFADGAFLYLPAGRTLSGPVQLLHVSTAGTSGGTAHPRNLILVEAGAELTVLEHFVSVGEGAHFTNALTELVAGEGARVEYCKFQDENLNAYHVAALHAVLKRGCNCVAHSFVSGAKLARNNIRTELAGEGVECILNGLYLTKDDQLADHHMIVDHAQPHCNSHEYFNGILDGRSRGVFHGRILVRPDAQKTDAKQTNKNLLLSDDAGVNTKPQLEIYADDVKCTHGATIGQLNDESIFYLRARGIGHDTARRMLMHAFAGEIIDRIRHGAIREELDRLVWDRLEENRQISVAR